MIQMQFTLNDKEYRRLGRVAKHLDYIGNDGKGDIPAMLSELTKRLVNARLSRDGHLYEAKAEY